MEACLGAADACPNCHLAVSGLIRHESEDEEATNAALKPLPSTSPPPPPQQQQQQLQLQQLPTAAASGRSGQPSAGTPLALPVPGELKLEAFLTGNPHIQVGRRQMGAEDSGLRRHVPRAHWAGSSSTGRCARGAGGVGERAVAAAGWGACSGRLGRCALE